MGVGIEGKKKGLGEQAAEHFAVHIAEAELAALVTVGEALVVDAEEVEDRRLPVVDVNGVFDDVVTEVVGLAVGDARFHAGADHPRAVCGAEVIAAVAVAFGDVALHKNGSAEFTRENHQRVFE